MFWIFILFASLAAFFVKLGAYSVWVSMLSLFLNLNPCSPKFTLSPQAWPLIF